MKAHSHEYQNRRHDNNSLSWRNFIAEKILARYPRLKTEAVVLYAHYGYLVSPSEERLKRPADDSFKVQKGDYSTEVILYGLRPETDDGRFSDVDMAACKDFLDEGSQYFGDEFMFSAVEQIVFLPPSPEEHLASREASNRVNWSGAVSLYVPGVVFINSRQSLDYDSLKHVLNHELAHIVHGPDISEATNLLSVVGWKVDQLDSSHSGWQSNPTTVNERYFESNSTHFSQAARTNPRETIAELYTDFMEDQSFTYGEIARDALISYLSNRSNQTLAAGLDWESSSIKY